MKIFFDSRMCFPLENSISPSSSKPNLLIDYWRNNPQEFHFEICQVSPSSVEDLCLVHSREYVDEILSGERETGFGVKSLELAKSLMWTCGSIVSAAEFSLLTGESSMSPTSGFHHAGFASAGGFCTFNGLVLVAKKLLQSNAQVGIIDLDEHDGDGTRFILEHLELESIIPHLSLGAFDLDFFGSYTENEPDWIDFENAEYDTNRLNKYGQGKLFWCSDEKEDTQHWMHYCSKQTDGTWRCTDFYGHGGTPMNPNEDDMEVRTFTLTTSSVDDWLDALPQLIEDRFNQCDLVLYQAGADSHIDDPLGGRFTTGQFRRRDQIVFQKLSELGIPVVWNLAGGYQEPIEKVLKLHTITAEEFHATFSEDA